MRTLGPPPRLRVIGWPAWSIRIDVSRATLPGEIPLRCARLSSLATKLSCSSHVIGPVYSRIVLPAAFIRRPADAVLRRRPASVLADHLHRVPLIALRVIGSLASPAPGIPRVLKS